MELQDRPIHVEADAALELFAFEHVVRQDTARFLPEKTSRSHGSIRLVAVNPASSTHVNHDSRGKSPS